MKSQMVNSHMVCYIVINNFIVGFRFSWWVLQSFTKYFETNKEKSRKQGLS